MLVVLAVCKKWALFYFFLSFFLLSLKKNYFIAHSSSILLGLALAGALASIFLLFYISRLFYFSQFSGRQVALSQGFKQTDEYIVQLVNVRPLRKKV